MSKPIKIFDTTLRDGEQSPGCSMNLREKLELALQLERLGVDVIEAGFAAASPGDFESVKSIANQIKHCSVASLARAVPQDIERACEALKGAANPRLHTFIATSPIHMQYKLKMQPEQVMVRTAEMVKLAASKVGEVEFSAEDATRSNPSFLALIVDTAIKAGAKIINLPDTVGYTTPDEYFRFLSEVMSLSKYLHKVELSVHCHNDLGLAVANSLAAIKAGATQIECTVNGIGERAGNAALEEIVMALSTRKDMYPQQHNIRTEEIMKTSRLLASITGVQVQPNKAIVGANAFAHESGIHQHGVLENRSTYEIMTPESVGLVQNNMVLGKHSGKHGFRDKAKALGFDLTEQELSEAFEGFKQLADRKKEVYDDDLIALLLRRHLEEDEEPFKLNHFVINSGTAIQATTAVNLTGPNGTELSAVSIGDGPVDAAFKAIDSLTELAYKLDDYSIRSVTEGNDALGESTVKLRAFDRIFTGIGMSTDILEASILAYLNSINKIIYWDQLSNQKTAETIQEGGQTHGWHDHDTKNPCA